MFIKNFNTASVNIKAVIIVHSSSNEIYFLRLNLVAILKNGLVDKHSKLCSLCSSKYFKEGTPPNLDLPKYSLAHKLTMTTCGAKVSLNIHISLYKYMLRPNFLM